MRHPTYEPFYVTRQHYYYSQEYVVEVVQGRDSIGADAFSPHYPDEFESFVSAVDAVQAAFRIQDAWHKDFPAMLGRNTHRVFETALAFSPNPSDPIEYVAWILHYLEEVANLLSQDWPQVALGNTWGASLELETGATDEELLAVAQRIDDNAPKCAGCGNIRQEDWTLPDEVDPDQAEHYCSESCANRAIEDWERQEYEFEKECILSDPDTDYNENLEKQC